MTKRPFAAGLLAALAIAIGATTALAAPMSIIQDAQFRNGPTVESTVIGSISRGTVVDVGQCNTDFCLVTGPGINGWVGIGYLGPVGPAQPPQPGPGPGPQPPQPGPGPGPAPTPPAPNPGPGFSLDFNFGSGGVFSPSDPADEARVCFFDRTNFRGDYFCAYEGDAVDALPDSWNDRISSIAVDRGLTAYVCRNDDFGGSCAEIDQDIDDLPSSLDNRISSFEVY